MKELGRDMIIITLKEPKWKQTDELDQGAKSPFCKSSENLPAHTNVFSLYTIFPS